MDATRRPATVMDAHDRPTTLRAGAVHPKWFTIEETLEALPEEPEDPTRFEAFMQLIKTAGALDRAATHVLADLNLTAGAFAALLELQVSGDTGLAPSQLARRLAVARRTATLYVDILARNGWAERCAHPDDKRMVLARLTDEGRHILDEVSGGYKQRLAALLDDLSPIQAERLRQLLAGIDTTGRRAAEEDIVERLAALV